MCPRDVNDNPEVYYQGNYWNDLDCTSRMINRRISGDDGTDWWRHFAARSERSFERGLFLNCGNGWVERQMVEEGFVREAVGVEFSASLLEEARAAAGSLPIRYHQMNINSDPLPRDAFDLVVNHAAAHHITMINRVFRDICALLPDDGWFISFDYVGPHRNQYLPEAWDAVWKINEGLPESVRQTLAYPHLPTMLVTDPTEAVHSELILRTFEHYFEVDELVPLGGAVAYPLLTFNTGLFSLPDGEREQLAQRVLDRDAEFLVQHPDSSLFAYFTGRPKKAVLDRTDKLAAWQAEEDAREAAASSNGGEYFERSALHDAYDDLSRLQQDNRELAGQLELIRNSYLYSHLTRVLGLPVVRRCLDSRLGVKLVRAFKAAGSTRA